MIPLLLATVTAFQVVSEVDQLASKDLWPSFHVRSVPIAVYDGEKTLLFRHPSPPREFTPVRGRANVWSYDGRYPAITANTSAEIGGIATATVAQINSDADPHRVAQLLIHEMFHVFQRTHHPKWIANEADLFLYPVTDARVASMARLQSAALQHALVHPRDAACWARFALEKRRERFARIGTSLSEYERGTEKNEGLATYIELRAAGTPDALVWPKTPFRPDEVRRRAYTTGASVARLLDRFAPKWRTRLEHDDKPSLDELLEAALVQRGGKNTACGPPADEVAKIERDARPMWRRSFELARRIGPRASHSSVA